MRQPNLGNGPGRPDPRPSFDGSSAPRSEPLEAPLPHEIEGPGPTRLESAPDGARSPGWAQAVWPYVQMARVDHWFKNAFMLLGVVIALFYRVELLTFATLPKLGLAVLITCIVASSNYVLNEYLDAPLDRLHPTKRWRPAALGLTRGWVSLLLWGTLGAIGIFGGYAINTPFGSVAFVFWGMACAYNIPPVRTKDVPYLDVVSESINNPLRLFLGWFALIPDMMPPISLAISYWMIGAFFMAAKRYAEYRRIADPARAASYRKSFRHYDEPRLLASMFFYLSVGSVFAGVFLVRYKLELLLIVPLVAVFLGYYALLSTRPDSPVQNPEKLYREPLFFATACLVLATFLGLMFVEIPGLYDVFNVSTSEVDALWSLRK